MKFNYFCSLATNIDIFEHSFSVQISGTLDKQDNVRTNVSVMRFRESIFVVGK